VKVEVNAAYRVFAASAFLICLEQGDFLLAQAFSVVRATIEHHRDADQDWPQGFRACRWEAGTRDGKRDETSAR
jgi:hypothetical protein